VVHPRVLVGEDAGPVFRFGGHAAPADRQGRQRPAIDVGGADQAGRAPDRSVGKLISPASGSLITIKRAVAVTHIIPLISSANTLVLSATSQIVTHLEAMAHNIAIGSGEARGQVRVCPSRRGVEPDQGR